VSESVCLYLFLHPLWHVYSTDTFKQMRGRDSVTKILLDLLSVRETTGVKGQQSCSMQFAAENLDSDRHEAWMAQ